MALRRCYCVRSPSVYCDARLREPLKHMLYVHAWSWSTPLRELDTSLSSLMLTMQVVSSSFDSPRTETVLFSLITILVK